MEIAIKLSGGMADRHKIPAYEGSSSLQGLSFSMLVIANYLSEGKVRKKVFGRSQVEFNLLAHQPGSFEAVYELALGPGGALALGVGGNLLTELMKVVYRRVTGQREDPMSGEMQELEQARAGDIAALVAAVEPSVRFGHNVINNGVMNINIISNPQNPEPIITLDRQTKAYMWESVIDNSVRFKLFSVGSFNANQGTGRVFDYEEGRTIPFELSPETDRQSVDLMLASIAAYTRKRRLGDDLRSAIAIKYTSVNAADGRIKKLRILSARADVADFGPGQ